MARPQPGEFPPPFERYTSLVDVDNITDAVNKYAGDLVSFYTSLPEEKADYAYAPGKWTLKEVLQHVIDAERVFSYRMMCIARKDTTPLPSFDENSYADNALASQRTFASLKEEFVATRKSTDLLLQSLNIDQLSSMGISGKYPASANSLGYVIFGHLMHHKNVTEERYL